MSTDTPFDPAQYVHCPFITIQTGITLGQTLIAEMPKRMPLHVKESAEDLGTTISGAMAVLAESLRVRGIVSDSDSRAIDAEADRSWRALRLRLTASSMIPVTHNPDATRAAQLDASLFGDNNLDFLQIAYAEQWPSMDALLNRIDGEGLADDINRIAGPQYLLQIRDVHPRYQAMVQAQLTHTDESSPDLRDQVRALSAAIVDYASKVAATVSKRRPTSAAIARKALRPIEAHREMLARNASRSGTSTPAEPEAPAATEAPASKTAPTKSA